MNVPMDSDDAPSYIYTREGLFFVPPDYIERDYNQPISISATHWQQVNHKEFSSAACLHKLTFETSNIVVLTLTDTNTSDTVKQCHWFVRFAIEVGEIGPLGANFLWQLPHKDCINIITRINEFELSLHSPVAQSSALVRHLRPTIGSFKPTRWPELVKTNRLHSHADALFAMSVSPACEKDQPDYRHLQHRQHHQQSYERPRCLQENNQLNLSAMPDDVESHILDTAVTKWLTSDDPHDWKALLALRASCRSARATVDLGAKQLLNCTLSKVRNCLLNPNLDQIKDTRDEILKMGLSTISIVLESRDVSFLTLARLRSNKAVGSTPPPPPATPQAIACVLSRVRSATLQSEEDEDSDSDCDRPTTRKSDSRRKFEESNTYHRRQLKRRRLLFERNRLISDNMEE